MVLKCPECGYPQYCGCCDHCRRQIPEGIHPYTWTEDGECIRCANCGFTAHADQWLDIEEEQLKSFERYSVQDDTFYLNGLHQILLVMGIIFVIVGIVSQQFYFGMFGVFSLFIGGTILMVIYLCTGKWILI